MKTAFVPMIRTGANYWVDVGRGWSVLEHMLLLALEKDGQTVDELAAMANLPGKVVVEALVNLLRANFIEIRASQKDLRFQSTKLGQSQAKLPQLTARQVPAERWTSLCLDRVAGQWFRADDLTLVYEQDLPNDAAVLQWTHNGFDASDARLRELLPVKPDETLRGEEARLRKVSMPNARVTLKHGVLEGLPRYAGQELRQALLEFFQSLPEIVEQPASLEMAREQPTEFTADIGPDDLFVGGQDQLRLIRAALESAWTSVFLHSCFVDARTVRQLLPDLERAAARKVKVDLLWGLNRSEVGADEPAKIGEARRVLDEELTPSARTYIQLAPRSSGSHSKLIVYDDQASRAWVGVVGTCNHLSTVFDALDVAVRVRSQGLAARLLALMVAAQVPAVGGWPAVARRLDNARAAAAKGAVTEGGTHGVDIIADGDHYAMVRRARDEARRDVVIACDLLGQAGETAVFVPLEEAARNGADVRLFYFRATEALQSTGRVPSAVDLATRGMALTQVPELHAKLLAWDDADLVVTSFNWLSTTVADARARGAEVGVHLRGPNVRRLLGEKLDNEALRAAMRATGSSEAQVTPTA